MPVSPDLRFDWIEPAGIPRDSGWRSLHRYPLVAALLYRRGMRSPEEAERFLHPDTLALPDASRIPNMDRAAARVAASIRAGETIGIFGDYDVDGVTSTTILTQALRATLPPERVIPVLPERDSGYGLNGAAIERFRSAGATLVIAVDCGSSDHAHAREIADAGMDMVIIDHHHMHDAGPETAITVSPRIDPTGEFQDLTAAALAWLFVRALGHQGIRVSASGDTDALEYLDLAALGTVADVAPLTGYNRAIVHRGIRLIRSGRRPGIASLLQIANQDPSTVSARTISHAIAPRINAAGRLASPALAMQLLMAPDRRSALAPARALEEVNARRRERSSQVHAEVYQELGRQPGWRERPVVMAASSSWESGIVGAVASRLAEELRRPVFLFRNSGGLLSGSARSVDGLDLMSTLDAIAPSLERYGGHSLAAGLSLREETLPALETHITSVIVEAGLDIPAPRRLVIDARLPEQCVSLDAARAILEMEPFGRGNEEPLLLIRDAALLQYNLMGQDRSHLKITVLVGSRQVEAILWRGADRSRELVARRTIDLVGRMEINAWNGRERLQFVVEDFRAS